MKQYIVFSEDNPTGEIIDADQLYTFIGIDGQVYEIGQRVGDLMDMAEQNLNERKEEK